MTAHLKQIFTPDEIRVILKWAQAYTSEHPPTGDVQTIGGDTLFLAELLELQEKVKDASAEIILGALNTCFLLGFDVFTEDGKLLQDIWDAIPAPVDNYPALQAYKLLSRFLQEAGLITRIE